MPETEWAVGITTVPERRETTLHTSIASLTRAGFSRMRLFVDGDLYGDTCRVKRIGAYGNWVLALWELYIRQPNAQRYAVFQDDVCACSHLREYLEAWYPPSGYQCLYTAKSTASTAPKDGWYKSLQLGRGALGLVFSCDAVRALLVHPKLLERPRVPLRGNQCIDGTVCDAMNAAGYSEWAHMPSLLQHTSEKSTVSGWDNRRSPVWRGEDYDPRELL